MPLYQRQCHMGRCEQKRFQIISTERLISPIMNVNYSEKNKTPKQIGGNTLRAAAGLTLYGIGVYLTIQANIGVAPWDCLFLGIRNHTVLSYGFITICLKVVIILIDYFIGERIGIGTIVDALVVGLTVDVCNFLDFLPPRSSLVSGILLMFFGLVVNGIGALCMTPIMQLVFQRMHFVPEDVIHQDFLGSFRVLTGRNR